MDIEKFWAEMLSENAERIMKAFNSLPDDAERQSVFNHLQKMSSEQGYASGQRAAAHAALKIIMARG